MLLKNRVIAKNGPREKDGKVQHYRFCNTKFVDFALTWGHPYKNILEGADIVGSFLNPRIKNNQVIADVEIDESKMTPQRWQYLYDNPDASMGYVYSLKPQEDKIYRDVHEINHIAIGIPEGVCSTPECGLATSADSSKIFDIDPTEEVFKIPHQEELKPFLDMQSQITALEAEKTNLQGQVKTAQDQIAEFEKMKQKIEEQEKLKLVEELVKITGQDKKVFEGEALEQLKKFRALLPEDATPPPDAGGTITITSGDNRPDGMPEKATVTYYGAKWNKNKPKEYVL